MSKFLHTTSWGVFLALGLIPFLSYAEDNVVLSGKTITVAISPVTGQVAGIAGQDGKKVLAESEDRYDLDGKTAVESGDEVISRKAAADRVVFKCVNRKLGLKIAKSYRLTNGVLTKETTYLGEHTDKLLLKVSSRSLVAPDLFADGYYYAPTDDGYKAFGVPFLAGRSVREPTAWAFSTGAFIYYLPGRDRTFAHYRYRINGRYCYSEVHSSVESKLAPGGAITALGLDFVNDHDSLTIESRYLLLNGDPREYHRHLLNQPPYTEYRNRPVPDWFPKCRMYINALDATMIGFVRNPDIVLNDVRNMLRLLPDDESLMVFFIYWSHTGDYPWQGNLRMYDYATSDYAEPVPVEKMRESIRRLKALSPRVKVGGYVLFQPTAGTPPYDDHPDWLVYTRDGEVEFFGDGTGKQGVADFSSGYRDFLLEQMQHYLTDLGFEWLHIDFGPGEAVNYRTKKVVQSHEMAVFGDELNKLFTRHNAAIVQNYANTMSLWAHGSYMECQQPDRWEKKDWRVLANTGSLGVLYRTYRPGVWVNLCYGNIGIYGLRNAQTGMRGWIRGYSNWWRDISHGLAYEKITDELLKMPAAGVHVKPCWWKLETDRLEVEPLANGQGLCIPLLLHADQPAQETISFRTAELGVRKDHCVFSFDCRLIPPDPLDAFQPVPWRRPYLETVGFAVLDNPGPVYTHRLNLLPRRNYYHIVTTTPAWVYSAGGARTSLPLAENAGVRISGDLPAGAASYQLSIKNDNDTARILGFVPADWPYAKLELNGRPAAISPVLMEDRRFVLFDVGRGTATARLSRAAAPATVAASPAAYEDPSADIWSEASARLFYYELDHRAYRENGMSCLALKETKPRAGGSVDFHIRPKEPAGGFYLKVKGDNSGGRMVVALTAGDVWTYEIRDNFTGWREFFVHKEQMTPATTVGKWEETSHLSVRAYPAAGREMSFADIRLLPARPGDIVKAAEVKRSLTVYRAAKPPVIDGYGGEASWKSAAIATDFFKYGSAKPAEARSAVRLCYDDDNLYILFDNLEPIIKLADARVPELQVFVSDHCHFFLDPFRDMTNYFEIGVDTGGTVADIRNSNTGWDIKWNGVYEVKTGLNYNVGWMCEMRIPFATLGKKPKAGDVWGITFARVDNTKEFSMWTTGEWNDPAGFGALIFSDETK